VKKTVHANGDDLVTVTFELPAAAGATTAALTGEFTAWVPVAMVPQPDGSHRLSVDLVAGRSYRFRYVVEGERWENDWWADDYVPNGFGGEDSVVTV
jgi:hypothetical protein